MKSRLWRFGNQVMDLADISAIVPFDGHALNVYLKTGESIKMSWYDDKSRRDQVAKSLSDAFEAYHLERVENRL